MELDMEKNLYPACCSVIGLDLTKSTESLPVCLCLYRNRLVYNIAFFLVNK